MIDLQENNWPHGRVGYCAVLGRPNVGKSTLLNKILNYHIAAVSKKPQTTRRRWLGIYSDSDAQILFLDTPGVHVPRHALGTYMQQTIKRAVSDADIILCITDGTRMPGVEERMVAETVIAAGKKTIIGINKSDIAPAEHLSRAAGFWKKRVPDAEQYVISASTGTNCRELVNSMKDALPWGPFLYEPDMVTDAVERQIAVEFIREAIYKHVHEEVPHATAVTIDTWDEDASGIAINATLHVERSQQRHILIGRGGKMIGRIRTYAENELSQLWDTPTHLHLWIKVSADWRKKPRRAAELA